MAVSVKQLYQSIDNSQIELLAGRGGMNRSVRWVHIVESMEIATFLEGGEIAFTTGVGLTTPDELFDLVRGIASSGGSAIVLNVGPYIKQIDSRIIEFCEERQIPLFQVPWNIYMAEIMRKFCMTITMSDKRELEVSAAVKNAILFPEQRERYVPHLENYGLHINAPYRVMLVRADYGGEDEAICRRIVLHQIENYVTQAEWNCTVMEMEEYVLLLFAGEEHNENLMESYSEALLEYCPRLRQCPRVSLGIGQETRNMYCISRSFREAKSVIDLAGLNIGGTVFYSRLGLYKVLFGITDTEAARNYIQETIGKLLDYDSMNQNNLTEVLRVYLKYNGSVKETAEEMYVHRNTINYKIRKIGELLGISLSDYEALARLNVAFKLYDIHSMEMGHL